MKLNQRYLSRKKIQKIRKNVFPLFAYLCAFSLALSPIFTSLSLLLFVLVALMNIHKIDLKKKEFLSIGCFSFLFILYVFGLFTTDFLPRAIELIIRISPIFFIPLLIVLTQAYNKINYTKFRLSFCIGIFISCLISFGYGFVRYILYDDIKYLFYFEFTSLFDLHPTYYALYIITAMWFVNESSVKVQFKIIGYSVYFCCLVFLQSKIGIVLFILLLLYTILNSDNKGKIVWFVFGFSSICILMAFTFINKESRINELFKTRNSLDVGTNNEDGISQRFWLWNTAISQLNERPLTGFGLGAKEKLFSWKVQKDILESNYGYAHKKALKSISNLNLHNNYIQLAYEFGAVGLILYLISIIYIVKIARTSNNVCFLVIYTFFLIVLFVEVALNRQMGIYFFAYILGILFFEPRKNTNKDENEVCILTS
ncbi:O-antigen ligase family protein [Maribacter antarcticus]|uniref:O-antigen ligase family protein n=1 Tax=Maribacter antarcticus TaxID=505250 RepID=UPI00047B8342|nr:O-antigen ligase family protein [Maribacter antarcticus]